MIPIGQYTEEERQFFIKQVTALYPEMYRFIKAQLHPLNGDMAEDLVQTACKKAWESFEMLKNRKSFRNWIFSILKNTRNEYYRAVFRENEILFFSENPEDEARCRSDGNYRNNELMVQKDVLEILIDEENSRRVIEAFDRLNEPEQQLLRLHLLGECSEKELAEMSGMNYNTLRSRIHRGLKKLKKKYEELDRGDKDE